MRSRWIAVFSLAVGLTGAAFAQDNVQDTKMTQKQLKQQEKAEKAQAKADKSERKALKTSQQKKADKDQDKADHAAVRAATPQN